MSFVFLIDVSAIGSHFLENVVSIRMQVNMVDNITFTISLICSSKDQPSVISSPASMSLVEMRQK